MEESEALKKAPTPARPTRKIFRYFRWILSLLTILFLGTIIYDVTHQKTSTHPQAALADLPDPEIKIIAEYQKARNSKMPVELAELQASLIYEVAADEGFPVELIVGIVEKETLFNPMSQSSAGATGLMQILAAPGITIDDSKRYDILYVLQIGAKILHGKIKKNNGNLTKALSDYSGGAAGYPEGVFENIGRYVMFKARTRENEVKIVEAGDGKETNIQ